MADTDIKDFDPDTPSNNITVMGVSIAQGATQTAQIDDAVRRILSVVASGDFGTYPVKADTISESTADTGVTIDGLLIKDGVAVGNLPSNSLGYIAGLVPALGDGAGAGDQLHDITISAGAAATDDNAAVMALAAAITKRIDAAWSVGTNQGGLDTGLVAEDTYFMYLIRRSDTDVEDCLFSLNASSPTMPAGYDQKRLIAEVVTNPSGDIIAFKAYETAGGGIEYIWDVLVTDEDTTDPGIAAVTPALSVPVGIVVLARFNAVLQVSTIASECLVTEMAQTNTAPSTSLFDIRALENSRFGTHEMARWVNTLAQIRYRLSVSNASTIVEIRTRGWLDPRR